MDAAGCGRKLERLRILHVVVFELSGILDYIEREERADIAVAVLRGNVDWGGGRVTCVVEYVRQGLDEPKRVTSDQAARPRTRLDLERNLGAVEAAFGQREAFDYARQRKGFARKLKLPLLHP